MVEYTLRGSCQALRAGYGRNMHMGFDLGRTKLGVTAWAPREISGTSIDAGPLRSRHRIPVQPKGCVVRTDRGSIRPWGIRTRLSLSEAGDFCGLTRRDAYAESCLIHPKSTCVGKVTKSVTPVSKVNVFASWLRAHPSRNVRSRGARPQGGAVNGMGTESSSNAGW
jgi:hypothetical protein